MRLLIAFHPQVWEKSFEYEVFQLSPPKDKTRRVDRVFSKFFTLPRCRARKKTPKKQQKNVQTDEETLLSWSQAHKKSSRWSLPERAGWGKRNVAIRKEKEINSEISVEVRRLIVFRGKQIFRSNLQHQLEKLSNWTNRPFFSRDFNQTSPCSLLTDQMFYTKKKQTEVCLPWFSISLVLWTLSVFYFIKSLPVI